MRRNWRGKLEARKTLHDPGSQLLLTIVPTTPCPGDLERDLKGQTTKEIKCLMVEKSLGKEGRKEGLTSLSELGQAIGSLSLCVFVKHVGFRQIRKLSVRLMSTSPGLLKRGHNIHLPY